MTIMTAEQIKIITHEINELKVKYFQALDCFDYEAAERLHKQIVQLNNSIC